MGKCDVREILILSVPGEAGRSGFGCKHQCSRGLKKTPELY